VMSASPSKRLCTVSPSPTPSPTPSIHMEDHQDLTFDDHHTSSSGIIPQDKYVSIAHFYSCISVAYQLALLLFCRSSSHYHLLDMYSTQHAERCFHTLFFNSQLMYVLYIVHRNFNFPFLPCIYLGSPLPSQFACPRNSIRKQFQVIPFFFLPIRMILQFFECYREQDTPAVIRSITPSGRCVISSTPSCTGSDVYDSFRDGVQGQRLFSGASADHWNRGDSALRALQTTVLQLVSAMQRQGDLLERILTILSNDEARTLILPQ